MDTLGAGFYIGLMVMALMIPLVLRWLKRSSLSGSWGRGTDVPPMRVLNSMFLGPGQKIIILEIGQEPHRRWLMLGITAQSVNLLYEIPVAGEGLSKPASPSLDTFQQLLSRLQSGVNRHG